MKRIIILVLLSFLIKDNIYAQSEKGDFTLSPYIGINFSTYFSDADYKERYAAAFGANVDYYFNDRWSLRTGVMFNPMGAEDGFNNTDKLNYLSVPINANWHFGGNRNWYLNFGPVLSFLLSADSELSGGDKMDIKDFVPGFDFGIGFGIGYKFPINEKLELFFDYQGLGGLIDIDKESLLDYEINNSKNAFHFGAIFDL